MFLQYVSWSCHQSYRQLHRRRTARVNALLYSEKSKRSQHLLRAVALQKRQVEIFAATARCGGGKSCLYTW